MKDIITVIIFYIFVINSSSADVKYQDLKGSISIQAHISLFNANDGKVGYRKYRPRGSGKKGLILELYAHSAISIKSAHSIAFLVFGKKANEYKLGYLWDLKKNKPVYLGSFSDDPEVFGFESYIKERLKNHYEIRYFWYTPLSERDKFHDLSYTFKSSNGIVPGMRFSEREEGAIKIYNSPNGKVTNTVTQKKIKELEIDSRIYADVSSVFKMKFDINDVKTVNGIVWAYIYLPVKQNTEISYVKNNSEGEPVDYFEFIDYKQSIFNKNVRGWIKLFNKDNRLQVRYGASEGR